MNPNSPCKTHCSYWFLPSWHVLSSSYCTLSTQLYVSSCDNEGMLFALVGPLNYTVIKSTFIPQTTQMLLVSHSFQCLWRENKVLFHAKQRPAMLQSDGLFAPWFNRSNSLIFFFKCCSRAATKCKQGVMIRWGMHIDGGYLATVANIWGQASATKWVSRCENLQTVTDRQKYTQLRIWVLVRERLARPF